MSDTKIGIIGYGVVGKAAYNTLTKKYDIIRYDKYQSLDNFKDLNSCEFVFIMVPTPFDCLNNAVDDSAILESLEKLEKIGFNGITIIKSTVPPGSCNEKYCKYSYEVVFNPEFLRESTTPNEDFENQDIVVIGTDKEYVFACVKEMYTAVLVKNAKYYHTSMKEAEMIKCAQNTMLASRVALANIIYDACESHNIEYKKIREIGFDGFEILGPHMTKVPGPDGKRGFGGKCLPKDIRAFSTIYDSEILKEIIEYNDGLRNDLDKVLFNYLK